MTLQLEVGKYYKNRLGEKIGPIINSDVTIDNPYKFMINDCSQNWTTNGKTWDKLEEYPTDLIEEWKDEEKPMCSLCEDNRHPVSSHDPVNHPQHYTSHPSGIECIQITRHMGFNLGNVMKYVWRADLNNGIEDLEKAKWYIQDEIDKRKASS